MLFDRTCHCRNIIKRVVALVIAGSSTDDAHKALTDGFQAIYQATEPSVFWTTYWSALNLKRTYQPPASPEPFQASSPHGPELHLGKSKPPCAVQPCPAHHGKQVAEWCLFEVHEPARLVWYCFLTVCCAHARLCRGDHWHRGRGECRMCDDHAFGRVQPEASSGAALGHL